MSSTLSGFFRDMIDRYNQPPSRFYTVGSVSLGVSNDFVPLNDWCDAAFIHSASPPTAQVSCVYRAADLDPISRWRDASFGQRVESLRQAGLCGFFSDETGGLEVFDPTTNRGLRMLPSTSALAAWEQTAPLTNFAAWSNASRGSTMVHAAAVGTATCGVLLCGPGGSGKSLLTLACALRGLSTVGDDYVILQKSGEAAFEALPYSLLAKQDRSGLGLLGTSGTRLLSGPTNWQNKRCFSLSEANPECFAERLSLNAVVSVRLGAEVTLAPETPRAVFLDIVKSTDRQLPAMADLLFPAVGQLTRALPTYTLTLGSDVWANVEAVKAVLRLIDPS